LNGECRRTSAWSGLAGEKPLFVVAWASRPELAGWHLEMDHQAFTDRVKEALRAKSEARPDDAVMQLKALLEDLKIAIKISVSDWHQQQTLSLLVDALDAAERMKNVVAYGKRKSILTDRS
jgi:hypothetical protein